MSNFIKLAREAREEKNSEDAKKFYDMARTEDPENVEAKFYYAFYNLQDAINRDVPNKFMDYLSTANIIVKRLKGAEMPDDEKIELLEDIVESHVYQTRSTTSHIYRNSIGDVKIYDMGIYNTTNKAAVVSVETMGNEISSAFGTNPTTLKLAAKCWKAIFADKTWNQWFYFQSAGNKEASAKKWEELVAKIKKIEPSFAEPSKPKAVQCGGK